MLPFQIDQHSSWAHSQNHPAWWGDSAKRNATNANKTSNNRGFWVDVQDAFVADKKSEARNKSLFDDNRHLANAGFNPQNTEQHSQEKLRSVWKQVDERCEEADCQFTQPGTNKSEFFDFCDDQKDICCLHQLLQSKPCSNDSVPAKPPVSARINSSLPLPGRKKRRLSPSNEKHSIADAMKET